jgi:hypothetical protein
MSGLDLLVMLFLGMSMETYTFMCLGKTQKKSSLNVNHTPATCMTKPLTRAFYDKSTQENLKLRKKNKKPYVASFGLALPLRVQIL